MLVGVDVCVGVEVNVRVGVGVRVLVGVGVRVGVKVRVCVAVGVEEGVEVNVFVAVGVAVAKNDDRNGLANGNPTVTMSADRINVTISVKPPMNQRPPGLPDLSGAIRPSFRKTK